MSETEARLLGEAIRAGIERHKTHRPDLYRGTDGIWYCPTASRPAFGSGWRPDGGGDEQRNVLVGSRVRLLRGRRIRSGVPVRGPVAEEAAMSHRPYPSWERALNQLWRHCTPRLMAMRAADRNALADFVFEAHPDLRELDAMLDHHYRTDDT